jgi:SAM-dependent methyltransferase
MISKRNQNRGLNPSEWHDVMIGDQSIQNIINRIEKKQYPIWIKPLLNHTSAGDSLLELGSGTGELSAILNLNNRTTYIMDFSEKSIEFSKELFSQLNLKGFFYCHDILNDLPIKSNKIDYVWNSGLIEHFSEDIIKKILKESYRVCKKGIMTLVPNANSIFYRIGKYTMEEKGTWKYGKEEPKFSMVDVFKEVGLEHIIEYSIGVDHSLKFWGGKDKKIKSFFQSLDEKELRELNQGYLLFTYGEK